MQRQVAIGNGAEIALGTGAGQFGQNALELLVIRLGQLIDALAKTKDLHLAPHGLQQLALGLGRRRVDTHALVRPINQYSFTGKLLQHIAYRPAANTKPLGQGLLANRLIITPSPGQHFRPNCIDDLLPHRPHRLFN